jgi:hypothetical protein
LAYSGEKEEKAPHPPLRLYFGNRLADGDMKIIPPALKNTACFVTYYWNWNDMNIHTVKYDSSCLMLM